MHFFDQKITSICPLQVKERVEKYGSTAEKDFEKEQHRGGAGKSAKSEEEISRSKPTTETTPTSPPSSSKKSPTAHEQVTAAAGELRDQAAATAASLTHHTEGLYVQAKEAVAQAARVTVERMAHVVEAAKEKVGIPKDKPLAVAAKEAVGIAPENPVREAAREATTSMTETAKEKAGEAVQGVRRVTVEELHGVTDRVVQVRFILLHFLSFLLLCIFLSIHLKEYKNILCNSSLKTCFLLFFFYTVDLVAVSPGFAGAKPDEGVLSARPSSCRREGPCYDGQREDACRTTTQGHPSLVRPRVHSSIEHRSD